MTNREIVAVLKRVEWAGTRQGQGSSMGSNDGYSYPACPECGQIKPGIGADEDFMGCAIGHKPSCKLAAILKGGRKK
jgi:hypothetical protein